VLVGPNSSGKTTFLDAIDFVKACLVKGPVRAVELWAPEYRDLTFMRRGGPVEIELWLELGGLPSTRQEGVLHYRVVIRDDEQLGVRVEEEILEREPTLHANANGLVRIPREFRKGRLLGKTKAGKDFYKREIGKYEDVFVFGLGKLALSLHPRMRSDIRRRAQ